LKDKQDEIDARDVCRLSLGKPPGAGPEAEEIFVRVGRYGPFLEQGGRRASLPDKLPPDELNVAAALEMLDKAVAADEPLGHCPETNKPVFVKVGRFGPYVQRGSADDEEKPQNASLLKGMDPDRIDLETALKLLSLPRTLGDHPDSGKPVVARNGRFGPYVACGDETRSLTDGLSPLDVTLEQALHLLAQPKSRRGAAVRKEPIKEFEPSPATNQPIRLLQGRYGPYVTDGETNASLPRGTTVEEVDFQYAVNLLKERAASGAAKGKPARKAAKSKSAKTKTTKAKSAKTKTAKTKTTRKTKKTAEK